MKNRFLLCRAPKPHARLRLFCFPHAGGAAAAYILWNERLPDWVEVNAVELPGRGARMAEPPARCLSQLVDHLTELLLPRLDVPFAFFGHSMGALTSFELCRTLRRRRLPRPRQLLVSAAAAPSWPSRERPVRDFSDSELKGWLRDLNGTSEAVLQHDELMDVMLPILRADFALLDDYAYTEEPAFDFPISVFAVLADRAIRREKLEAWRGHTNADFSLRMFPGNHFFVHQSPARILAAISEDLGEVAGAEAPRVRRAPSLVTALQRV